MAQSFQHAPAERSTTGGEGASVLPRDRQSRLGNAALCERLGAASAPQHDEILAAREELAGVVAPTPAAGPLAALSDAMDAHFAIEDREVFPALERGEPAGPEAAKAAAEHPRIHGLAAAVKAAAAGTEAAEAAEGFTKGLRAHADAEDRQFAGKEGR